VLLLLAAYALLAGPIEYLVLRILRRHEWSWMTTPLAAATFTVLVLAGTERTGWLGAAHQEIAVFDVPPERGWWNGTGFVSILCPRGRILSVRPAADKTLLRPAAFSQYWNREPEPSHIYPDRIEEWRFQHGETRGLRLDWAGTCESPIRIHLDGDVVRIENNTADVLFPAFLVDPRSGKAFDLGWIGKGVEERRLSVSPTRNISGSEAPWNGGPLRGSPLTLAFHDALKDTPAWMPVVRQWDSDEAIFLAAGSAGPLLNVEGARTNRRTTVLWHIRVER
jgi:hypothetical protein